MTKRMLTMLLAAVILLSANGCAPAPDTAENSSSSSVTTEELQVLQEENEKLKQELAELKGEAPSEKQDVEASDSDSDADDDDVSSSQTSTPATNNNSSASANTQAPAANNNSSSAAASKPNNQAAKPQAEKPAANNTQTAAKPQTPAPQKTNSSTGKGLLAKYTVNVSDSSTPAVKVVGETLNGKSAYYFYSDGGKLLGNIPMNILTTIIRENDLSYAEADEQKAWFVENFNIYRGLDGGSYEGGSGSAGGGSSSSNEIDIEEFRQEVIRLTNKEREKAGVAPLVEDSTAMEYAQIRAEEVSGNFSHYRPNNKPSSMDGLEFIENIASGPRFPKDVVNGWINSPGHKATLLSEYSDYGNRIGVGCYEKDGKIYWTQEFVLWDANA